MRVQNIKSDFFIRNRRKLISELTEDSLVIVFSNPVLIKSADQSHIYRHSSDMFYLSGISQDNCILTIYNKSGKWVEELYVENQIEKDMIWQGRKLNKTEAANISGIDKVLFIEDFIKNITSKVSSNSSILTSSAEKDKNATEITEKLLLYFSNKETNLLSPIIYKLRTIKEPEEILMIKRSIEITRQGFYKAIGVIAPEKYEYEVEAAMIGEFMKNGADGHAFEPIIASGQNACYLHYIKNNSILKSNNLVLMDFGSEYNGYAADISRTVPVNGVYGGRSKEVYQAVLDIANMAHDLIRPGISILELNEQVRKLMDVKMVELGLLKQSDIDNEDKENPVGKKFYMHGVSHNLGLDVHDVGDRDAPMQKGMVITFEPGLYIMDEKIGVRIENDWIVDDNPINLSSAIEQEIIDIENLFRMK